MSECCFDNNKLRGTGTFFSTWPIFLVLVLIFVVVVVIVSTVFCWIRSRRKRLTPNAVAADFFGEEAYLDQETSSIDLPPDIRTSSPIISEIYINVSEPGLSGLPSLIFPLRCSSMPNIMDSISTRVKNQPRTRRRPPGVHVIQTHGHD